MNGLPSHNHLVAMTYAQRGIFIIPCRESDTPSGRCKTPYVAGGMNSASSSGYQIDEWWRMWPNALIGMPCRQNGTIVIDADRHGGEDGVELIAAWFRQYEFDSMTVPCIGTPNQGYHFMFRRPLSLGATKGRLASGVDVRDRAYVIAAGSRLPNGREYALWNGTPAMLAEGLRSRAILEPPEWLLAMLRKETKLTRPRKIHTDYDSVSAEVLTMPRLKGIVLKVAMAPVGERNSTLHWAACRVGEMVMDGHISRIAAFGLLVGLGRSIGLSLDEADRTVHSGIGDAGLGQPLW